MSSTYSASLRLELIGSGDQTGTWGTTTNTNLGTLLEQAITGVATKDITGLTTYTLTSYNGTTDEARNAVITFTGALGANCEVIAPAQNKLYIIRNNTSGGSGYAILFKPSGGASVSIPNGATQAIYCDTSSAYAATVPYSGTTGTGNAVLAVSPTLTGTPLAPTATAGTSNTQIATTAFVTTAIATATAALGTMATQNASSVAITGGTVSGITGSINSVTPGSNSVGARTVSSSAPSGGSDGDIWYKI